MALARDTLQSNLNRAANRAALHLRHVHSTGNATLTSLALVEVIRSLRNALSTCLRNPRVFRNRLAGLALNVLRHILEYLDLVDRVALAQTSHDLRNSCVELSRAWNTVSLREDTTICLVSHRNDVLPYFLVGSHRHSPARNDPVGGLLSVLRFSAPQLLDLDISAALCPRLVSLLKDVMGRTVNVSLNVFTWCLVQETQFTWDHYVTHNLWVVDRPQNALLETVANAFRTPGPQLRSLSFTISNGSPCIPVFEALELPTDFLCGRPGQLRTCRLGGIWLQPTKYPALSCLRVFEYAPFPGDLRASELDCILEGMTQLETFGLTVSSFHNDSGASFPTPHCGRLRNIGFSFPAKPGEPLRSREFFQRTVDDVISFCNERHVPEIALSTGWSQALQWSYFPSYPSRVEIGTNVVLARYEGYTVLQPSITTSPDLFQRLTTLTIWTCLLRLPINLPPAPVLQSLCVLCDTCQECSEPRDVVPQDWRHPLPWNCPSLRIVHITGPGRCSGVVSPRGRIPCRISTPRPLQLPVLAVEDLLIRLRIPTRLLDKLTISGVLISARVLTSLSDHVLEVEILDGEPDAGVLRVLETRSLSAWDSPSQIFDPAFRPRDLGWSEVRAPASSVALYRFKF